MLELIFKDEQLLVKVAGGMEMSTPGRKKLFSKKKLWERRASLRSQLWPNMAGARGECSLLARREAGDRQNQDCKHLPCFAKKNGFYHKGNVKPQKHFQQVCILERIVQRKHGKLASEWIKPEQRSWEMLP